MSVYAKINAIQAELSKKGIGKGQKSSQGYEYRGIDDAQHAIAGLLATHKLCILPRVVNQQVTEREKKNGGVTRYAVVTVQYDFMDVDHDNHNHAGGKHTCTMVGEGFDSGDKAINKALSNAYKYLCWQAFCIPTVGVDVESGKGDEDPAPKRTKKQIQAAEDAAVDAAFESDEDERFINQVRADMSTLGLTKDDFKKAFPDVKGAQGIIDNAAKILVWLEDRRTQAAFDKAH